MTRSSPDASSWWRILDRWTHTRTDRRPPILSSLLPSPMSISSSSTTATTTKATTILVLMLAATTTTTTGSPSSARAASSRWRPLVRPTTASSSGAAGVECRGLPLLGPGGGGRWSTTTTTTAMLYPSSNLVVVVLPRGGGDGGYGEGEGGGTGGDGPASSFEYDDDDGAPPTGGQPPPRRQQQQRPDPRYAVANTSYGATGAAATGAATYVDGNNPTMAYDEYRETVEDRIDAWRRRQQVRYATRTAVRRRSLSFVFVFRPPRRAPPRSFSFDDALRGHISRNLPSRVSSSSS